MSLNRYKVGKRYGKALFELAEAKQVLDAVFHDVQVLREHFKEDSRIWSHLLSRSSVEWTAKKVVLDELTEDYTYNFKERGLSSDW